MVRLLPLVWLIFPAVSLVAQLLSAAPPSAEPADAPLSVESKYLSGVRQVTSDYQKAGEGYFSPDGREIVYQAIREGYPFYQIYSESLANPAEPQRVSTGRGRTTCSYFHPTDPGRILLASSHLDPQLTKTEQAAIRQAEEDARSGRRRRYSWVFDPHMDLFEATPDGVITRRLTDTPGYDAECAYSPDGEQVVFCSDRDGDPDLYVLDIATGDVRQVTDQPGYDGGPFFSPDGDWIVYRTDRKKKDYLQIHVVRADASPDDFGSDAALTDINGVNWAPYWHPTEPWIIWTGADHSDPTKRPNYDLWMLAYEIDAGGRLRGVGEPIRVTDNPAADVLPVFSPDGSRLMWTAGRTPDRRSQLWIADFRLPETVKPASN